MDIYKKNISMIPHSISLYNASFIYTGLQMYNVLSDDLKEGPLLRFKHTIKNILQRHCFYSINEFFLNIFQCNENVFKDYLM